jgi:predicted transcriptional regulator
MQTIKRSTRHERLCSAIRKHGWRRRGRIEIVAGILKECLVGQTYTELVYLMRIGAKQVNGYLMWLRSMGLLEKEIRNVSPRGMTRSCIYNVTTPKGEAVLKSWFELVESLFGDIPEDREPAPL